MDTKLLSNAPKKICDQVEKKSKLNLPYLTFEKGKIHAGYQIPLKQHAASLEVIFNPKKPEQGIDIKLQVFGADEHRRWDQYAAFGAVLTHYMADGFADGIPPKINYAKPEGVELTLHLPQGFKKSPQLIETIHCITTKMISSPLGSYQHLHSILLIDYMQNGYDHWKLPGLSFDDWSQVGEECFASSFYINIALMDKFKESNDSKMLMKVAKNSLLGLAKHGMDDYTRDIRARKQNPSLKDNALQALKGLIHEDPSTADEVKELIKDPDMLKHFPAICDQLNAAIGN